MDGLYVALTKLKEVVNVYPTSVFVISFFVAGLLYFLSHFVCNLIFPSYRKLSRENQVEWNSRVVSNIHALIVTWGSLRILASDVYDKYPFTSWSAEGGIYCQILLGYFAYDLILVLLNKQLCTAGTVIHHLLGLFYYTIVTYNRQAQYLAMLWLASELTTPFVNMRWFLFITNRTNSLVYTVNGLLMTIGFLLWRVLYIPGSAIYTIYYMGDQIKQTAPLVATLIPVSVPSITILNAYWTYLMIKGILKHVGKKDHSKSPDQNTQKKKAA